MAYLKSHLQSHLYLALFGAIYLTYIEINSYIKLEKRKQVIVYALPNPKQKAIGLIFRQEIYLITNIDTSYILDLNTYKNKIKPALDSMKITKVISLQ
ncbi:MAG: hypothetical protein EOO99_03260 [Pedobacter sp.]|nr:MAG: hypothetical protein EOO99_03260 [Pedobacter sp.]